jgi:hypothetical protein
MLGQIIVVVITLALLGPLVWAAMQCGREDRYSQPSGRNKSAGQETR